MAHTFWGVLSNILFICRGYGGYRAVLHTLPQVYGGVWVGEHCQSCIDGGVNCSNYYLWLTNFVQNREGNCATFCGYWRGRTVYRTSLTIQSPSVRFTELSDDNSVVAKFATTAADGKILQNKKGHSIEWPCIHDGGDEGNRTPDLLTASQALSQLSYAPVTRRYYRGRFLVVQEVFWVDLLTYGFSWDGAELTDFDFGKISQLTHRPDKTLTV